MDSIISPVVLYAALAVGAAGVAMSLPRRRSTLQILGALLAGVMLGAVALALGLSAGADRPGVFFYPFALISLAGSLRVITHPRPVYAALYFVLTILSTAGLFLMLSAEFLTFALVIIYAGAILITYLFVIMLATEAPTEESLESLREYDASARDPIVATIAGFMLLAILTGMLATGLPSLGVVRHRDDPDALLAVLPRKVERAFENAGFRDFRPFRDRERIRELSKQAREAGEAAPAFSSLIPGVREAMLILDHPDRFKARLEAALSIAQGESAAAGVKPLSERTVALIAKTPPIETQPLMGPDGRGYLRVRLPDTLRAQNIELVGFAMLAEHPLVIELAGVILLLALVGAVILARKQVELAATQLTTLGASATGRPT